MIKRERDKPRLSAAMLPIIRGQAAATVDRQAEDYASRAQARVDQTERVAHAREPHALLD